MPPSGALPRQLSHLPEADQVRLALSSKIIEIAQIRRRFGYRRIHDLLRPEFSGVNHKRMYHLYTEANLTVRRCREAKRPPADRVPLQLAKSINNGTECGFSIVRPQTASSNWWS
uniref:IS3 family transposase n=1 Tax=Rhodoferax sp. GW822-FHT02A01 TaxID=3141537 RepID=UPI00406C7785